MARYTFTKITFFDDHGILHRIPITHHPIKWLHHPRSYNLTRYILSKIINRKHRENIYRPMGCENEKRADNRINYTSVH